MNVSFPILSLFPNSFMMGDFNFHSTWKEQKVIDENNFDDNFLTFNQGKESFTMPVCNEWDAWRPDKILTNKSSAWLCKQINIIGGFNIPSF